MRVRSLESRILGARPSESMSPGLALLNGESFGVNPSSPGFPGVWGHVFTNNGNQYGIAAGDCYYLAITAGGALLIGVQVNDATTITWRSATLTPL